MKVRTTPLFIKTHGGSVIDKKSDGLWWIQNRAIEWQTYAWLDCHRNRSTSTNMAISIIIIMNSAVTHIIVTSRGWTGATFHV